MHQWNSKTKNMSLASWWANIFHVQSQRWGFKFKSIIRRKINNKHCRETATIHLKMQTQANRQIIKGRETTIMSICVHKFAHHEKISNFFFFVLLSRRQFLQLNDTLIWVVIGGNVNDKNMDDIILFCIHSANVNVPNEANEQTNKQADKRRSLLPLNFQPYCFDNG